MNNAFTKFTGLASDCVLGRPLCELVQDPVVAAALQTSCPKFSLADLNNQKVNVKNANAKNHSVKCKVMTQSVGQENQKVTHFALELEEVVSPQRRFITEPLGASSSSSSSSSSKHGGAAFGVMG